MSNTTTIVPGNLTREPESATPANVRHDPTGGRRQPALAEPDQPGVAGGDVVLRRDLLA